LDMPESDGDTEGKTAFPASLSEGISLKNVSFSYPESKRKALNNVSLSFPAGKTVALVGVNGSGKTTLVKLICKLFEPDSGDILVDGVNIKNISPSSLIDNIAVLFQKIPAYNFSASDNIRFGDKGSDKGFSEVAEAARKAGIHDMLAALPQAYDTVLGKIYEDSEELSMGQWQRIGLARVFYKNSQVVVLDEPTSFMDPDAEYQTFANIKEILAGKTVILVSHRFSTVKMADYIYVLENESLAEQGTHDELISLNGKYANLYHKQAMYYKS